MAHLMPPRMLAKPSSISNVLLEDISSPPTPTTLLCFPSALFFISCRLDRPPPSKWIAFLSLFLRQTAISAMAARLKVAKPMMSGR